MAAEFDAYAEKYRELLRDPIRDRFAKTNDFYHIRKWQLLAEYFARTNFPTAQSSWLDIGCGKGELLSLGSGRFKKAFGCDPSEGMTQAAENLTIVHQPLFNRLPFGDQEFDFVTAVCVYHHVEEEDRVPLTKEVYRVLRPNGVFCIIEHNPWNPVTKLIVSRLPIDANAHLVTPRRLRVYAKQSNMRSGELINFLFLPEPLYKKMSGVENILKSVPMGGQYAQFFEKQA